MQGMRHHEPRSALLIAGLSFSACATVSEEAVYDDFAACAVRPPSTCNREDTCFNLGCGTPQIDADGCVRKACAADAECPDADRCVHVPGLRDINCEYGTDGTCDSPSAAPRPPSAAGRQFGNPV